MPESLPLNDSPSALRRWLAKPWVISVLLVIIVAPPYLPMWNHDFANYDDDRFLTENPAINRGFTSEGWHFTFGIQGVSQWHPLTFITHMIDVELFGAWAGGHKYHNLLLHLGSTVMLFHLLRCLTSQTSWAALAALFWGVHPLRVEGVAWIAERKEVLSTFFGLSTLLCYWAWVQRRRWWLYALTLLLFVLAILSKPIWVSAPCMMLLFDYWPFRRIESFETRADWTKLGWLIIEKLPFFPFIVGSAYMTMLCQYAAHTVGALVDWPMSMRVSNALLAYWWYIQTTLLPLNLCPLYRLTHEMPLWLVALAGIGLVMVTWLFWHLRNSHRYLLVFWLFYLGTNVPAIGLVQVGGQRWADRYAYVPALGLIPLLIWGGWTLLSPLRIKPLIAATGLAAATAVFLIITALQVNYWRTSESLWLRALDVDPLNQIAHNNLGHIYYNDKKWVLAEYHFWRAATSGHSAEGHINLANMALWAQKYEQAELHARLALRIKPYQPSAILNLGNVYASQNRLEEAVVAYRRALELNPLYVLAYLNYANTLVNHDRAEEAIPLLRRAIELAPTNYNGHISLARAFLRVKRNFDEAETLLKQVHMVDPNNSYVTGLMRELDYLRHGEPVEATDAVQAPTYAPSDRAVPSEVPPKEP